MNNLTFSAVAIGANEGNEVRGSIEQRWENALVQKNNLIIFAHQEFESLPESVKLQLLVASQEKKEFQYSHLSIGDLVLFFRVIDAFNYETRSNLLAIDVTDPRNYIISFVIEACFKDPGFVERYISELKKQNESQKNKELNNHITTQIHTLTKLFNIADELRSQNKQTLLDAFVCMFDRDQKLSSSEMGNALQMMRRLHNFRQKDSGIFSDSSPYYELNDYGYPFAVYQSLKELFGKSWKNHSVGLQTYHAYKIPSKWPPKNPLQLVADEKTNILSDGNQVYLVLPIHKNGNHFIAAAYHPGIKQYVLCDNMNQDFEIIEHSSGEVYTWDNDFVKRHIGRDINAEVMQFALTMKKEDYEKIKNVREWENFSWKMPKWSNNNCYLAAGWLMANYEKNVCEIIDTATQKSQAPTLIDLTVEESNEKPQLIDLTNTELHEVLPNHIADREVNTEKVQKIPVWLQVEGVLKWIGKGLNFVISGGVELITLPITFFTCFMNSLFR